MITKEMISEKWDMILSIMQSTYGVSNITEALSSAMPR